MESCLVVRLSVRNLVSPPQGHLSCFLSYVLKDHPPGNFGREGGLLPRPVLCLPVLSPEAYREPGMLQGWGHWAAGQEPLVSWGEATLRAVILEPCHRGPGRGDPKAYSVGDTTSIVL